MSDFAVRDFKTSLRLDGTTTAAVSGTTPAVTGAATIAFWINTDLLAKNYTTNQTPRIIRTTDDGISIFFRQSTGNFEVKLTTTQGAALRPLTSGSNFNSKRWICVIITYDKTKASGHLVTYVNNVQTVATTRDGTDIICNNTWVVGDSSGAGLGSIQGYLDKVVVSSSAWTATERANYYRSSIIPTDNQVFKLEFDESYGTTAEDSSGNGKDATITNGAYSRNAVTHGIRRPRGSIGGFIASSPNIFEHHNGITTDGTNYYAIDNQKITKYDASWNQLAQNTDVVADTGIQHLGGGQYYDGLILSAAENYGSPVSFSLQRIAIYNASDLSFVRTVSISAEGNEVSGCTVDPTLDILYVSSYVTSNAIYMYKLSDMIAGTSTYLGQLDISGNPLTEIQDITLNTRTDYFYISAAMGSGLDKIFKMSKEGIIQGSFRPFKTGGSEGVDYTGPDLLVMDESTGSSTTYIRTLRPTDYRQSVNGNLVRNGDFSVVPEFTAATSTNGVIIDGTAAGTSVTNDVVMRYQKWRLNFFNVTTASAMYDTAVRHSGTASLKMSATVNKERINLTLGRRNFTDLTDVGDIFDNLIRVEGSTQYTFSVWVKQEFTNVVGSPTGGRIQIREHSGSGFLTSDVVMTDATSFDWSEKTLTFTTNKATRYINFELGMFGNSTNYFDGDMWVDNVSLVRVTPLLRQARV